MRALASCLFLSMPASIDDSAGLEYIYSQIARINQWSKSTKARILAEKSADSAN